MFSSLAMIVLYIKPMYIPLKLIKDLIFIFLAISPSHPIFFIY